MTTNHNVSETGSASVFRRGEGDPTEYVFPSSRQKTKPDPGLKRCIHSGRWAKSINPLILNVIQHRQNPLDSKITSVFVCAVAGCAEVS
jgi:hypothetical protein